MDRILLGYLAVYGYILTVLILTFAANRLNFLGSEGCRKFIHISLGGIWMILYRFFYGTIHLVVIPVCFVLINYYSYRKSTSCVNKKGLTALLSNMERSGSDNYPGTVYYALSVTVLTLLSLLNYRWFICGGIGLFCMTLGDGMASVIGSRSTGIFSRQLIGEKSLGGSIGCIIFGSIGCALLLLCMGETLPVGKIILIGLCCGILELPGRGIDNLTVPVGCALIARCLFITV